VERANNGPGDLADLRQRVGKIPGIVGVAPFISGQVLVASSASDTGNGYVTAGVMRGVLPGNNPVLVDLGRTLVEGSLQSLGTSRQVTITDRQGVRVVDLPTVIVGKALAQDVDLHIGDPVTIIAPLSVGAISNVPRLKRFAVGGFFYSGMGEYDSALVFVAYQDANALFADDSQLDSGLEVRVAKPMDAPAIAAKVAAIAGPAYTVKNWTQTNASLFSALKLEKFSYFLVLLLMVLVAAFNIIATLVMVVMERRKEIAILQAMGARARSIAAIFLFEGAALGLIGTVVGVSSGALASYLIGTYHLIKLPADIFQISYVPVRMYAGNFLAVAAASIVLCILAALYPAMQARSLSPVEVIRYE
jgi:lipoprotein-releasing system permease protein